MLRRKTDTMQTESTMRRLETREQPDMNEKKLQNEYAKALLLARFVTKSSTDVDAEPTTWTISLLGLLFAETLCCCDSASTGVERSLRLRVRAHSNYGGGHVLCFISDVRVLWNASQRMKKIPGKTFSSYSFLRTPVGCVFLPN